MDLYHHIDKLKPDTIDYLIRKQEELDKVRDAAMNA